MATKIAPDFYQISSTESLTFTISGPDDPHVFLDNTTLQVASDQPFTITPQDLNGLGAVHFMNCILMFPDGEADYEFDIESDETGPLDHFVVHGPNQGSFTKVQFTIKVA